MKHPGWSRWSTALAVGTVLATWFGSTVTPVLGAGKMSAAAPPTAAPLAAPSAAGTRGLASQVASDRALAAVLAAEIEAQGVLLAKLAERADAAAVRLSELERQLKAAEAAARLAHAQLSGAKSLLVAEAVTAYTQGGGALSTDANLPDSNSATVLVGYATLVATEELGAMDAYALALHRERSLAALLSREAEATRAASRVLARDAAAASAEQATLRRELSALKGRLALDVAAAERQQEARQQAEEMAVLAGAHDLPPSSQSVSTRGALPPTSTAGVAQPTVGSRLGTALTSSSLASITRSSLASSTARAPRAATTTELTNKVVEVASATSPATTKTRAPATTTGATTTAAPAATTTAPAATTTAPAATTTAPAATTTATLATRPTVARVSSTTENQSGPASTSSTVAGSAGAAGGPAPGWQVAVAFAESQMGKPYRWGGAGPGSYDCSGLTMVAWGKAGVSLPHSAQDQYDLTTRVPIADLQPGDLVFFGTPSDVYHVGLYIGGGEMVDAPETGQDVMAQSIYELNLLAGGRVR